MFSRSRELFQALEEVGRPFLILDNSDKLMAILIKVLRNDIREQELVSENDEFEFHFF